MDRLSLPWVLLLVAVVGSAAVQYRLHVRLTRAEAMASGLHELNLMVQGTYALHAQAFAQTAAYLRKGNISKAEELAVWVAVDLLERTAEVPDEDVWRHRSAARRLLGASSEIVEEP